VFQDRISDCAAQVSACLKSVFSGFEDVPVVRAMDHATAGGKRLRAFLVMEGARLHGIVDAQSVWAAAAVEAMHGYSLVHDDLPCMDDDALRRGQPTVHVKWDEATAVLAGDGLQALAYELLARPELSDDAGVRLELVATMARAGGAAGMVLGQAQDIAAETANKALTLAEITVLQGNKTGALIGWSAQSGAVLGKADVAPLARYATALGRAFQIADDILDVEGDAAITGKNVGKDANAGKATFVSLLGLESAKSRARDLAAEAEAALAPYGDAGHALREAARFVISRDV
jgi:farnesyl diphosphate synthase